MADTAGLDGVLQELTGVGRYGLDTEFHRERTYWPKVALVQLSWESGEPGTPVEVALVDPLAVDLGPFSRILSGPATMLAHAAEQDLEILALACGRGPARLLDTQVAAGFCGHGSASLASLAQAYLGRTVAKGDRLTDWSARPLQPGQLRYAASDVEHLPALADALLADLDRRGRRAWAEEECEALRSRPHGASDPGRAWWRLRDSRQLKGQARAVAQEVAAWRELRARRLDIPVRHVLPDLALQSIAHRPPRSRGELAGVRGLDQRYLRGEVPGELLEAIERGRSLPADAVGLPPSEEVPRELRPAVALAMAWVAQLARDEEIDASLLATRADIVALLADDPAGRLASGWRAGLVGAPLQRLVAGEAALAFDGKGGLVVEERSGRPLGAAGL